MITFNTKDLKMKDEIIYRASTIEDKFEGK